MLSNTDGTANTNGMWNLMRKTFPKHTKPIPVAKKDVEGRLITSQNELKELYLNTFKHRLRHRPMAEDLKNLEILKEELCSKRLELCKLNKSKDWDLKSLRKVLSKLKTNKARDPHGLVNDLFKPGVCGSDLENSLLTMFNKIKNLWNLPCNG